MNSKFSLMFVCFVTNLVDCFNVSTVDNANRLDNLFQYDDSQTSEFTFKDIFNLHHSFVIEQWKWEDGQVNFKIDKKFNDDEIDKILDAMHEIESASCIRFAAYEPSYGPDYVMIEKNFNGSKSSSYTGCIHVGEQILTLNVGMISAHKMILHELLHTIGFGHHHQRSDRDQYIEIHLENANLSDSEVLTNYATQVRPDERVMHLTPFDFDSVMLYDEDAFSIYGESVITSKIEGKRLPTYHSRNRHLSMYDTILLNRFYDCHIVDKKKSKLFYENEKEILYPKVVNYHEVQRAKDYFVEDDPQTNTIIRLSFMELIDLIRSVVSPRAGDKDHGENGMNSQFNNMNGTHSVNGDKEVQDKEIENEYDDVKNLIDVDNTDPVGSLIESDHVIQSMFDKLHEEKPKENSFSINNKSENENRHEYAKSGASRLSFNP